MKWDEKIPKKGVWNQSPAFCWEEAFVGGNGKLGMMVFGDPIQETIIGNHCRLYLPKGNVFTLPDMAANLPYIRELIQTDGYDAALAIYQLLAKQKGYQGLTMSDPYHPAFFLTIHTGVNDYQHYSKSIDYQTGEIAVHFTSQGIRYQSKSFASYKDDALVYQLQASEPVLDCKLVLASFQGEGITETITVKNNQLNATYCYQHGTGGYHVAITVNAPEEAIIQGDAHIHVKHTDQLLLFIQIEPFQAVESVPLASSDTDMLASYETLFNRHRIVHQAMFDRVSLDLVSDLERSRSMESLLAEGKRANQMPAALLEKVYDAGRYMYIASAGELTPNLQGIWTGTFEPAWSGDFTFDTNVQLSIASALSSNLTEGLHGLFRLVKELLPDFRENAKKYYGCRGIMVPAHAGNTGKHVHWNQEWPLHFWTCGAGWVGHWFYQYYVYTGDELFLREEAVPYLEEVALFYEDFLIEDPDGTYRFCPSYSAENGCADNATQDIAVAKEVFTNLISSYQILNMSQQRIKKWEMMLAKLPNYQINQEGALKEWLVPEKEENYNHRHFSHLYPIFQSREFTAETEPLLWRASEIAFAKRLEAWLTNKEANTSSTHGRMHAALCATQFHMPDLIEDILNMLVKNDCFYPSLMMSHYNHHEVFNVDGNGAFPQVVHESLIDCHHQTLYLLGALPLTYSSGSIKGVHLVNQIEVTSLDWNFVEQKAELTLLSRIDQRLRVVLPLYPNATMQILAQENAQCQLEIELKEHKPITLVFSLGERSNHDVPS